jgi:hypothetical protein
MKVEGRSSVLYTTVYRKSANYLVKEWDIIFLTILEIVITINAPLILKVREIFFFRGQNI